MAGKLTAPFPWFGGKSRVADLIWSRFGNVDNYIEPFAGSLAVLLGRPNIGKYETVNDADGFIVNFWRAVKHDPEAVAAWANNPVFELDLHARHGWIIDQRETLTEQLRADPDYFDAKVAGYWVWGGSLWFGDGWGKSKHKKIPNLTAVRGIFAKSRQPLPEYMQALAGRLKDVRIISGDWRRVCKSKTATTYLGATGVFLDPPYKGFESLYYGDGQTMSEAVGNWARDRGDDPKMRIAVCGYDGEHNLPGWICVPWKANGGYGTQAKKKKNENRGKERIWFSPHCLSGEEMMVA